MELNKIHLYVICFSSALKTIKLMVCDNISPKSINLEMKIIEHKIYVYIHKGFC